MLSRCVKWTSVAFVAICYLWGIAIVSVGLHAIKTNWGYKYTSSSLLNQIANEWQARPYVDIKVIKVNSTAGFADCPSDYP